METNLKKGQNVKHKSTNDFDMTIIRFACRWINNQQKDAANEENPEYPICRYYNIHIKDWEEKEFLAHELYLSENQHP